MILTGDIGGTKTLLAAHEDDGTIVARRRYASREAASLDALVARFLEETAARPRLACFGVAGPVLGARVKVTHLPWEIDAAALAARFGLQQVRLLNDFAAAAHGVAAMSPADLVTLQAGEPLGERPTLVIGAGTGLGVAYVLGEAVLSGEGGHATFAPVDARQDALWQWLRPRVGRVQAEHVASGRGLAHIFEFLLETSPGEGQAQARQALQAPDPAAAIGRRALDMHDDLALAAIDLFISCFGALAGDHALTVLARGGVYVAGGIAPRLLGRMAQGGFVAAFNDKGPDAHLTRACPVHVVTNPDLPLLGAARHAARSLTPV
jgi:glucokinase